MLRYSAAKAKPNAIIDLTSLSEAMFEQLVPHFVIAFDTWRHRWTTTGYHRENLPPSNDTDHEPIAPEDRLLFILAYLHRLPTQDEHSHLFNVPKSTTSLWIRTLLPVLRDALIALQGTPSPAHTKLWNRVTLNPMLASLLQQHNQERLEADTSDTPIFTEEQNQTSTAPRIQINRRLAQSLVLNKQGGKDKITLKVGELFSGAGGFGLGFILANHPFINYQPIFAIDNDRASLATYQQNATWLATHAPQVLNHSPQTFRRDIQKLRVPALLRWAKLKPGDLDLLIGGPPCQGFSTSNKTNKLERKLANNSLVNTFLDRVDALRPKMFLMENVQGIRWTKPSDDMTLPSAGDNPSERQQFKTVHEFLRAKAHALDYVIWDDVLDAADFGVPQHRKRFFLFGIRRDLLAGTINQISLTPYLEQRMAAQHMTVDQAIGDLPVLSNGQSWEEGHYKPAENSYINTIRLFLNNGELFDHHTTVHQPYVIDRFHLITEGNNWEAIREQMNTYNSETIDNTHRNIYRRLRRDAPANTISHYRKSMVIHPSQDRGLSFREACRLQSFPDWFRFAGIRGAQQQQLANAVPPLMAASVAYAIAELFLDEANRKHLSNGSNK